MDLIIAVLYFSIFVKRQMPDMGRIAEESDYFEYK